MALYDIPELVKRHFALSDLKESSDDSPHHVTQKAVCLNLESHSSGRFLKPMRNRDIANIGLDLSTQFAETREVADREQDLRGIIHHVKIEREEGPKSEIAKHGLLVHRQPVMIGAAEGGETAVQFRLDGLDGESRYIGRQNGIELEDRLLLTAIRQVDEIDIRIEVADEIIGVDSGVRTSATHNVEIGVARELTQRISHDLLDCRRIRLHLPSVVIGAVVG